MLHSTDDRGSNEGREYEATTNLFEPAFIFEYYLLKTVWKQLPFLRGKSLWSMLSSLDFYGFAGIGGASFSVNGNDALVQRGLKKNGFTAVIPGGIGATLIFTPNIKFGLELGGRYTFTGLSWRVIHHNFQKPGTFIIYWTLILLINWKQVPRDYLFQVIISWIRLDEKTTLLSSVSSCIIISIRATKCWLWYFWGRIFLPGRY